MPSLSAFFFSSLCLTAFVHRLPWLTLLQQHWLLTYLTSSKDDECWTRPPPIWPPKLVLVQRRIPDAGSKVDLATTVTYYDSTVGGNLIQITPDNTSKPVLMDLELDTHQSYYYYPNQKTCRPVDFPVGILRRNWLSNAEPLGPILMEDGSQTCGWTKVDFIDYYANKATNEPVSWYFHTMKATFQVVSYQENVPIDPALFVPPEYCPSSSDARRV